jgi:uncharacterized membrane protein
MGDGIFRPMSLAASRPTAEAPRPTTVVARIGAPALAVGLMTAAVFALRLSQIHQSLFGDELWTYQQIHGHSFGSMFQAIHPGAENAPPLFFVLAWISSKLGDPTVWIRLPSVILGTATVPAIYALGRFTVGTSAGLIGAAAFALSPFSAYYGTEARPYATVAFFAVVSTLALIKALRSGSLGWWALYALAAAAAAYTHYTAVFVLAVQGAWSLWMSRDRLRVPLIANGVIVLLYAPWIPHLKSKQLAIIGVLEPLNLHNIGHDLAEATVGYPLATLHQIPTAPGGAAIAVGTLFGLAAFATGRRPADHRTVGGLPLLAALAIATPAGVLAYSLVSTDIWDPRDLYASIPYCALLVATLLAAIPWKLRVAAVVLVLGTLLAGTIQALTPAHTRPQFRTAAQYLDRVARPGDPVILYPSFLSLDNVITVEFRRPHVILKGVPPRWPAVPSGGAAYVLYDQTFDALRVPTPQPAGFALVGQRSYGGPLPFRLLTYRRLAAGG